MTCKLDHTDKATLKRRVSLSVTDSRQSEYLHIIKWS